MRGLPLLLVVAVLMAPSGDVQPIGFLPVPVAKFGCPPGPCATALEFAVNGCTCAGAMYTESTVSAQYCCAAGFSDVECPEAFQRQTDLEAVFGATREEVESQLVTVYILGWPALVHGKAAAAFEQVDIDTAGLDYLIQEPIESYYRREVGGHQVLSYHAFGIAVDINPSTNPSCGVTEVCRCYNDLITDMPAEFVQAFKDSGFEWGGDWAEHPDPMHLEWQAWQ